MKNNGSCSCDELIVRGKRVPPRSGLIGEAEKIADSQVAVVPPGNNDVNESRSRWNSAFSRAMDMLCEPLLNGNREKLSAPLLRQSDNGTHEQKAV